MDGSTKFGTKSYYIIDVYFSTEGGGGGVDLFFLAIRNRYIKLCNHILMCEYLCCLLPSVAFIPFIYSSKTNHSIDFFLFGHITRPSINGEKRDLWKINSTRRREHRKSVYYSVSEASRSWSSSCKVNFATNRSFPY